MTQEAFRLVGVVEARTRAAENDLRRFDRVAQNSARSLNSSMGSTERGFLSAGRAASGFLERFSHISQIIQGIPQIGQLAGALTRPLFNAAQEGIKLNMVLEQATIGYTQVAGSEQLALKFLKELQTFGQRSPFRFEGLLQASRLMTAFGFDLDEQIPKLRIWGNAIAASGELSADKIHDVVTAFGQMRMAGRVNAQDMMQLTNANIPGWELLARAIGKTVAETRKLSEAGRIDGGKAVEAITAMMAIDPRYKDMMARLEKTTAGRLSAAEDVLQFAQAKATRSLTTNISQTLEAALQRGDLADSLAGSIDSAISPVAGAIRASAVSLLGGGITGGISEGIAAGKAAVMAEVGSLGQGVIDTFANMLGIQSPSKVFIGFGVNAAEGFTIGFEQGLSDGAFDSIIERFLGRVEGQLSGTKRRSATNLAKLLEREPNFKDKLIRGSRARGINPDHLLNVMAVETAGSFNPAIKNPNSSASGLIQFMAATARELGTTTEALRKMSATQQLDFVFKYFDHYFKNKDLSTQGALYAAVGAGKVGSSDQSVVMTANNRGYAGNAATWDPNRDGIVRQGEMAMAAIQKLGAGVNFTINGSAVSQANPLPVTVVAIANGMAATQSISNNAKQSVLSTGGTASVSLGSRSIVGDLSTEQMRKVDGQVQAVMGKLKNGNQEITAQVTHLANVAIRTANQALEETVATQDKLIKGAGEWGDIIVQNEESLQRLQFDWNAVGAGAESAMQRFFPDLFFEGGKKAGLHFLLGFVQSIGDEANRQFSAIVSKWLFNFDGGASASDGGMFGTLVRGLFSKIGLGKKKGGWASFDPGFPKGTMPSSTAGVAAGAGAEVSGGVLRQAIKDSTDKITSSMHEVGNAIVMAGHADAEYMVNALTPRQPGFLAGLLNAAVTGAVSGAAGALTGGLLGGGFGGGVQKPDEGPPQPRPTTPPVLGQFQRRAAGGDLIRGQAYLFGEQGPELGVFPANGTMLPNNHPATQMALNGGRNGRSEVHKHYHFNVHAHGADAAQSIQKSRRQLARQARETLNAAA